MHDYEMFTNTGNCAVQAIMDHWQRNLTARNQGEASELYRCVLRDLEQLMHIAVFSEATDTAVREAVYRQCQTLFPEPVFVSRRNKTA